MKRNYIILVAFMIFPFLGYAQTDTTVKTKVDTVVVTQPDTTTNPTSSSKASTGWGIKAGLNYNDINGLNYSEGYQTGYHFGIFFEWGKGLIGLQPEILFSQVGTKISDNTASDFETGKRIKLSYLQIPILVRVNLVKILTLHAGPQFGFLLNKSNNELENGTNAFKSNEFAMCFGAQVNLGNIRVYGRYNIGLTDINDLENQEEWKNQVFQLGLGLKLF